MSSLSPSVAVSTNTKERVVLFDGRRGHLVKDIQGDIISLVFITCGEHHNMRDNVKAELMKCGFRVPEIATLITSSKLRPMSSGITNGAKPVNK